MLPFLRLTLAALLALAQPVWAVSWSAEASPGTVSSEHDCCCCGEGGEPCPLMAAMPAGCPCVPGNSQPRNERPTAPAVAAVMTVATAKRSARPERVIPVNRREMGRTVQASAAARTPTGLVLPAPPVRSMLCVWTT